MRFSEIIDHLGGCVIADDGTPSPLPEGWPDHEWDQFKAKNAILRFMRGWGLELPAEFPKTMNEALRTGFQDYGLPEYIPFKHSSLDTAPLKLPPIVKGVGVIAGDK